MRTVGVEDERRSARKVIDMKKKKGGRSSIIKDLTATGLTARKAVMAVNAVFDYMTLAAWWGEPVEIPGGLIQSTIRQGRPREERQRFRDIQTRKIAHKSIVFPGRRRVLKFTPDLELDLEPLPAQPLPETPEQEAVRRLVAQLLGRPAGGRRGPPIQAGVAAAAATRFQEPRMDVR
jgi:hypothetical protein